MTCRFGRALERLNSAAEASLTDSVGSYRHNGICENDIPLMVDRDVSLEGAGGVFRTGVVTITWRQSCMGSASRGGIFIVGACRFVVEDEIANDGQWITVACMEQK